MLEIVADHDDTDPLGTHVADQFEDPSAWHCQVDELTCSPQILGMPTPPINAFKGYRFPREIISYAVWLYFRFSLSLSKARYRHARHEAFDLWEIFSEELTAA